MKFQINDEVIDRKNNRKGIIIEILKDVTTYPIKVSNKQGHFFFYTLDGKDWEWDNEPSLELIIKTSKDKIRYLMKQMKYE